MPQTVLFAVDFRTLNEVAFQVGADQLIMRTSLSTERYLSNGCFQLLEIVAALFDLISDFVFEVHALLIGHHSVAGRQQVRRTEILTTRFDQEAFQLDDIIENDLRLREKVTRILLWVLNAFAQVQIGVERRLLGFD